jgi:hypothetical protein
MSDRAISYSLEMGEMVLKRDVRELWRDQKHRPRSGRLSLRYGPGRIRRIGSRPRLMS